MSPLIFVNGVILASAAAITLGLLIVLLLILILGEDYPRFASELQPLLASSGVFAVMTVFSAASFLGLVRQRPWRWVAQAAMWLTLAGVTLYFWPR